MCGLLHSEKKMVEILSRASKNGVSWSDDIGKNWGATFWPAFRAESHAYWGVEGATNGQLSKGIFPQRQFLSDRSKNSKPWLYHPSEKLRKNERVW